MSKGSDRRNALKGQCLILEEKNIQLEYNLVAMTNLLKNISMILKYTLGKLELDIKSPEIVEILKENRVVPEFIEHLNKYIVECTPDVNIKDKEKEVGNTSEIELDPDYKVGYKCPPKHTRFQKGNKGNPKGRKPKEDKGIFELLVDEVNKYTLVNQNGKTTKLKAKEVIAKSVVQKIMKCGIVHASSIKLIHRIDGFTSFNKIQERAKRNT